MSFIDLVKKRRSARRYSERPVSREIIDQCLEAARLAPSACNSQPWSFIVVDNPEKKNEIVRQAMSGIYKLNTFVAEAPVIVVVVTERSRYVARLGGLIRNVKYNLIDIGIACDHLTLQAEELGVGTCWLGWFHEKKVKKILNLPRNTHIDILISMGYPQETSDDHSPKEKNRRPLEEIRSYV